MAERPSNPTPDQPTQYEEIPMPDEAELAALPWPDQPRRLRGGFFSWIYRDRSGRAVFERLVRGNDADRWFRLLP
jgi:hypothetical protein